MLGERFIFFDKAFSIQKEDCKDHDLWLAVESAAGLPASNKEPLEGMNRLAFKQCYSELKDQLKKTVSESSYTKANLCPGLKDMKVSVAACK